MFQAGKWISNEGPRKVRKPIKDKTASESNPTVFNDRVLLPSETLLGIQKRYFNKYTSMFTILYRNIGDQRRERREEYANASIFGIIYANGSTRTAMDLFVYV